MHWVFYTIGIALIFTFPLAFLLMLWANDTGAYIFGVKYGKRKLFERHSPKKSWEGFFGGMLTAALVGFGLSFLFKETTPVVWVWHGYFNCQFWHTRRFSRIDA